MCLGALQYLKGAHDLVHSCGRVGKSLSPNSLIVLMLRTSGVL